jgi:hypothetical protein
MYKRRRLNKSRSRSKSRARSRARSQSRNKISRAQALKYAEESVSDIAEKLWNLRTNETKLNTFLSDLRALTHISVMDIDGTSVYDTR